MSKVNAGERLQTAASRQPSDAKGNPMQAAVIREFGDPDRLHLEEVPIPEPRPGHVLVKILSAGVNRLDHYIRQGAINPDLPLPHVLGADAVGEIAELGGGVGDFRIGDRVIVVPGFPADPADYDVYPASLAPSFSLPGLHSWGAYAQFIAVPARFVVRDETGLTPELVATLPVVLSTSVRAVKEVGGVKRGDHVLIQAGASGSGSMQIQVAKALHKLPLFLFQGGQIDFVSLLPRLEFLR